MLCTKCHQSFSVRTPLVYALGFAGHTVSVTATHLCIWTQEPWQYVKKWVLLHAIQRYLETLISEFYIIYALLNIISFQLPRNIKTIFTHGLCETRHETESTWVHIRSWMMSGKWRWRVFTQCQCRVWIRDQTSVNLRNPFSPSDAWTPVKVGSSRMWSARRGSLTPIRRHYQVLSISGKLSKEIPVIHCDGFLTLFK